MEPAFWHARWQENRIGFHLPEANPLLIRYWPVMQVAPGSNVLVPLCGKSLDMIWLREQGHRVAGIEISQLAVEAFFGENGLTPVIRQGRGYSCWSAEGIELLCGDFFSLPATELGRIDGCYDRAALVALPAEMRATYAAALLELMPPLAPALLVTLEYDPAEMDGPPFSVPQHEVRQLFGTQCHIEHLHTVEAPGPSSARRERGPVTLLENCFRLVRN
jgi:thiopurine S-methyltransferase